MMETGRCLRGTLRLVACAALAAAAAWAQSAAGGTIETVAGTGTRGYSGDGGPATSAQLNYPYDVAVDGLGNVYIADSDRIRKVDASTGNISTFAGGGYPNRLGAVGVAVDASGNLYIADNNNRLVHKVDVSTGNISIFAGGGRLFGSRAEGAAARAVQISPRGLAVDLLGNVYITESGYDRVYKVNAAGIVSTVAGTGESSYGGDGGAATSAQLHPDDVAVDGAGNLYIADTRNLRIRKVDACTGNISTIAGTGTEGYGGDGGPATSAQLNTPTGVAVDASGNVYIADYSNYRIRKVDAAGVISTVAGNGESVYGGDGGPATSAQLDSPKGVAVDASGNIYIADQNNHRIRKVTMPTTQASSPPAASSIRASAATLSFSLRQGAAAQSQTIILTAGPGGADFTATSDRNWLTAQPSSGSLSAGRTRTLTVTANPAGLDARTHNAQLRIAAVGGCAAPVEVSLAVQPARPAITASSPSLSFSLRQDAAAQSRTLRLTAGLGGADFTVTSNRSWLTAQPSRGSLTANGSRTLTVTADPAGLDAGAHNGQLRIAVRGGATAHVAVSLTVQPARPAITASPAGLSFTLRQDAPAQSGTLILTAGAGGASFTATSNRSWLTAQPNRGSLSAGRSRTLTVTADPAGLDAGAHDGQLRIAVSGGDTARVAVSLTVQPARPAITASPAGLSFSLRPDAAAQSETLILTAGAGGAEFTATSNRSWLTAQPSSGSLSASRSRTLTVAADPAGLDAGAHSGQLRIAVRGGDTVRIPVSLTVRPPPSIAASPPLLAFSLRRDAAAQSETIVLTAGAGGAEFTVTSDRRWLTAQPSRGSLNANRSRTLTVTADPAGLDAGAHSGQLRIAVEGGAAVHAAVSLQVTAAAAGWTIRTVAGTGTGGFSGDGGLAISAQLLTPHDAAADAAGNLYVADSFNNRIRKVDAAGGIVTVAGSGESGYGGDGGPAIQAQFAQPVGVALDAAGNLYIADWGNNRVRKVDAAGNISTVAGTGESGYGGDGGPVIQAQLSRPYGAALDAAGNLYIADWGNNRIRKVDAAGNISTVAGTGESGYSGDGGPAAQAQLAQPYGLTADAAGNLYITDSFNNRIRKVDAAGVISTVAGSGEPGYGGDGGPALQAQLAGPVGAAMDAAGNLYVADGNNQRIRMVDAAGVISTVAGNGESGYGGDGGAALRAQLAQPRGLAADAAGNLYAADSGNHRIRLLTPAGAAPRIASGGVVLAAGTPVVRRIAPNAIVSVFGQDFAPPGRRTLVVDAASGLIASNLASTCLEIGGASAPLFLVSPAQINAQVPHGLTAEQAAVTVVRGCGTANERRSAAATVAAAAVSPAFFNAVNNPDGRNPVIALRGGGNGLVGSPELGAAYAPAEPGETVTLYGTGFGATDPPLEAGRIPGVAAQLIQAPVFSFGGMAVPPEDIVYAGAAPCCAGLYQFAVRLPRGLPDGDAAVAATVQGVSTPRGPFLTVRRP